MAFAEPAPIRVYTLELVFAALVMKEGKGLAL